MIDHIHVKLSQWADWIRRRDDGGIGFPKQSSYTRLQGRSGSGFVEDIDGEAWETEKAVSYMRMVYPDLYRVVDMVYRRTMTDEQRASRLGCDRATVYRRLERAHRVIDDLLKNNFINTLDDSATNTLEIR